MRRFTRWRTARASCFWTGVPSPTVSRGRLKWELRATWLGGVRILDRLEAIEFDVFRHRPALGVTDAAAIAGRVVVWR